MNVIHYFAYGSNMLTQRLKARCASARPVGIASLAGFHRDFSKIGRDGSGKATLVEAASRDVRTYGVVFELATHELEILDRFEGRGKGYERFEGLNAERAGGKAPLSVATYIAQPGHTDPTIAPFDWYLQLVIAGAAEHRLPQACLAALRDVKAVADPLTGRETRLEALDILARMELATRPDQENERHA